MWSIRLFTGSFNDESSNLISPHNYVEADVLLLANLENALLINDYEKIDLLFQQDFSRIINSTLKIRLFKMFQSYKSFFYAKENEAYLGKYYLYNGHMYFMANNIDEAKYHYQSALSYSLKYKQYTDYGFALNGYAMLQPKNMREVAVASKYATVLANMNISDLNNPLYITYFYYVKTLIANGDREKVCKLNESLSLDKLTEKDSFEALQIILIKFVIASYLEDYQKAVCIAEDILKNPLFEPYIDLKVIISEALLKLQLTNYPSPTLRFIKTYTDTKKIALEIVDDFNAKVFELNSLRNAQYNMPISLFHLRAERLFQYGLSNYALVLIDPFPTVVEEIGIESLFKKYCSQLEKAFKDTFIIGTKIETSKIIYVVKDNGEQIQQKIESFSKWFFSGVEKMLTNRVQVISSKYPNNQQYSYTTCFTSLYAKMYYKELEGVEDENSEFDLYT